MCVKRGVSWRGLACAWSGVSTILPCPCRPLLVLLQTKNEKFNSGGSSGAFLYYSSDNRFIVKTMEKVTRQPSDLSHMHLGQPSD